MIKYAAILALSAGLAVAGNLPANAQPMARHAGTFQCRGGAMVPMMAMRYPDGALAFLHTELHITPAQTSQWDRFAKALTESAHQLQQQIRARPAQAMGGRMAADLPTMLRWRETMLKSHLASVERIDGALIPLYQALDSQQKQMADQLFVGCGPRGWHGPGPRHWR